MCTYEVSSERVGYYNDIIGCCIDASSCIPKNRSTKRKASKIIPGWNEHVKQYKCDAIFWHMIWKQCNSPRTGHVYDIRRRTRSLYHNALRNVRRHEEQIRSKQMADSMYSGNVNQFWSSIKKIRGRGTKYPSSVDDITGSNDIATLFQNKYKSLYNSVSFCSQEMAALKAKASGLLDSHHVSSIGTPQCSHGISVNDVMEGVAKLKRGKHDGYKGHFSDHVINGTNRLYIQLSLVFNSMLIHGYCPKDFLLSTLVPIPKNKQKSLNCSDNYRAIALSSILGKILDNILLVKCSTIFQTSDMQYGFKKKHSTNHCTFVVQEVIKYYSNNNSNVLTTLIDASKAFDRVEYCKLFSLLLSKGICPLIGRFLLSLYTNQSFRVKWCDTLTILAVATNGVKQGGVMSPLLFTLYIDQLLLRLKNNGYGCHIGNVFYGALSYADDIIIMCPTLSGMNHMLNVCEQYGMEYNVIFNPVKTKFIFVNNCKMSVTPVVKFMDTVVPAVPNDKHLGFPIGDIKKVDVINRATADFVGRVNAVKSHFKYLPPDIMYRLFKQYCMPLYGCPLWDLSHKSIERFYVSWRKSIRFVLGLPRNTHCALLPEICSDINVNEQLNIRFAKFIKSLYNSNNQLSRLCAQIAINGSSSNVSNNITVACKLFNTNRNDLCHMKTDNWHKTRVNRNDTSNLVIELLNIKYENLFIPRSHQIICNDHIYVSLIELCEN